MRSELVAAFNVGLAVIMQIILHNRKKAGTPDSLLWFPWQPMIACLHLSGLAFLVAVLPGTNWNWLAILLFAASFSCMCYFFFAVLRNGPAYRREQAILQKQREAVVASPVMLGVTNEGKQDAEITLTDSRQAQEEGQVLKRFR